MLIGCADGKLLTPVALTPDLPDWPSACRTPTPHAALTPGIPVVSLLARERFQLNTANRNQAACADFYDGLRSNLSGAPQ